MKIHTTKTAHVVWNNTDLTEGRGEQFPQHVCQKEATAIRLSKGAGVQGTDASVRPEKLVMIDHDGFKRWYGPVQVILPNAEDARTQDAIDLHAEAVKRAIAAGISEEDIMAIQKGPQ